MGRGIGREKNSCFQCGLGLIVGNLVSLGNYEPEIKAFIRQPEGREIINNHLVYILHGGGKTVTLFRFYLTNLEHKSRNYPCQTVVMQFLMRNIWLLLLYPISFWLILKIGN